MDCMVQCIFVWCMPGAEIAFIGGTFKSYEDLMFVSEDSKQYCDITMLNCSPVSWSVVMWWHCSVSYLERNVKVLLVLGVPL